MGQDTSGALNATPDRAAIPYATISGGNAVAVPAHGEFCLTDQGPAQTPRFAILNYSRNDTDPEVCASVTVSVRQSLALSAILTS